MKRIIINEIDAADFFICYQLESDCCIITELGIAMKRNKDAIFPEIIIPSEIEGMPVTGIKNNKSPHIGVILYYGVTDALDSSRNQTTIKVKKLILPNTIKEIQNKAFEENCFIESVIWPESCIKIPGFCFRYSTLKEIIIPEGVEKLGTLCFSNTLIESIVLPRSCKRIGIGAFENAKKLKEAKILSDKSITLNTSTFMNTAIEEFTFPSCTKVIPSYFFDNCPKLRKITISGAVEAINNNFANNCPLVEYLDLSGLYDICLADVGFFSYIKNIKQVILPVNGIIQETTS